MFYFTSCPLNTEKQALQCGLQCTCATAVHQYGLQCTTVAYSAFVWPTVHLCGCSALTWHAVHLYGLQSTGVAFSALVSLTMHQCVLQCTCVALQCTSICPTVYVLPCSALVSHAMYQCVLQCTCVALQCTCVACSALVWPIVHGAVACQTTQQVCQLGSSTKPVCVQYYGYVL